MSALRCWASGVSSCDGGISREHPITRGIWQGQSINIGGLPHLCGERKDFHIDDVVAKVLCRQHNAALSPLDQAVIDFANCIREIDRLRGVRQGLRLKHRPRRVRFTVDGSALERWTLKTAMNIAFLLRRNLGDWALPDWVPEVVFGQRKLSEGAGLALLAKPGSRLNNIEGVRVIFGGAPTDVEPTAVSIELLAGIRFVCSWGKRLDEFAAFTVDGETYLAGQGVIRHPNSMLHRDVELALQFDWSGNWTERRNPGVVLLREAYKAPPRR